MCDNILSVVFCPVTSLVSEWGFFLVSFILLCLLYYTSISILDAKMQKSISAFLKV